MQRKVTVASSAANKAKAFMTNAETWEQLKPEIQANGLSLDSVEAIMNPGNVTLSRNDARLFADGEFKIYLVPTKNKAGISDEQANAMGAEIAAAIKKAASKANSHSLDELKSNIIGEIEIFYDVDLDDDASDSDNAWDLEADADPDDSTEDQSALREARQMGL